MRATIYHNPACGTSRNTLAPWIAALGMAGSSLAVTLNALRLARSDP
jgi:cation transport ATPase